MLVYIVTRRMESFGRKRSDNNEKAALDYSEIEQLEKVLDNVKVTSNQGVSASTITGWRKELAEKRLDYANWLDRSIDTLERALANNTVSSGVSAFQLTEWRARLSELQAMRENLGPVSTPSEAEHTEGNSVAESDEEVSVENEKEEAEQPHEDASAAEAESSQIEDADSAEAVPAAESADSREEPAPAEVANASTEEGPDREKYLSLKKDFKAAQREYLDALEADYKGKGFIKRSLRLPRNVLNGLFGLGRKTIGSDVQAAYDKYMAANTEYHRYAKESGVYAELAERLADRASKQGNRPPALERAVMNRHVLRPAERRLEAQQLHVMPERLKGLQAKLGGFIKDHPRWAFGIGAGALVTAGFINPAMGVAMATGVGANYAAGYAWLRGKTATKDEKGAAAMQAMQQTQSLDFEALEQEMFAAVRAEHAVRSRIRTGAAASAMVAGGVTAGALTPSPETTVSTPAVETSPALADTPSLMETSPDDSPFGPFTPDAAAPAGTPDTEGVLSEPTPTAEPAPTEPTVTAEVTAEPASTTEAASTTEGMEKYTVKSGENVSTIVYESIKTQLESGALQLPPGMETADIVHRLYQTFPEMTDAADVAGRLSPEQWRELGVGSGDPQLIKPGETINVQALIDQIVNPNPDPIPVAESTTNATPTVEAVSPDAGGGEATPSAIERSVEVNGVTYDVGSDGAWQSPFADEAVHQVTNGNEKLVQIMQQIFEQHVAAGEARLPSDVNSFTELLLQRFPELQTVPDPGSFEDQYWYLDLPVADNWALSPEAWRELGVGSGNPLDLQPGDKLDVRGLFETLYGSPNEAASSEVAAMSASEPLTEVPTYTGTDAAVESVRNPVLTEVQSASRADIFAERTEMAQMFNQFDGRYPNGESLAAARYDYINGFYPKMTEAFAETTFVVPDNMTNAMFADMLDQQTYNAYQVGDINLPAYRVYHLEYSPQGINPSAIGAFVNKNAAELAGSGSFFNFWKEPLDLTATQWRELGFSSGKPEITPGDEIMLGELTKLVLENAAKRINT